MQSLDLRCEALFPAAMWKRSVNPTHVFWRELIESGFPFVKVELLRDNPIAQDISDWPQVLVKYGGDIETIAKHLESINLHTAGLPYYRAHQGGAF